MEWLNKSPPPAEGYISWHCRSGLCDVPGLWTWTLSAALSWVKKSLPPLPARVSVSSVPAELLPTNPLQLDLQLTSLSGLKSRERPVYRDRFTWKQVMKQCRICLVR